jgi:16S rRNA (cytidine1402-2'-O)-methyltransferase
MGTLYVVATPIGNLADITHRALETLQQVAFIFAEDTRVTKKLVNHYNIQTPLRSYHQHSKEKVYQEVLELLQQGNNLALVTDAGTPGVSDPGNELIAWLLEQTKKQKSTKSEQLSEFCTPICIVPIPGPSAVTALASIAGVAMDKFLFLGYPPAKKGRTKFFEQIGESKYPVIFYESPYRVLKSLSELQSLLAASYNIQDTKVVVGRELTKKFESVYRGTIEQVQQELVATSVKGEFVILFVRDKVEKV